MATKKRKTSKKPTARKINVKRLLLAAQATLDSNASKFTMHTFGHECGTPACVLGNYAHRRDLQDAFQLIQPVPRTKPTFSATRDYSTRHAGADLSGKQVRRHFGITEDQAEELFGPVGCGNAKTPQQAVKYILDFILRDGKKPRVRV